MSNDFTVKSCGLSKYLFALVAITLISGCSAKNMNPSSWLSPSTDSRDLTVNNDSFHGYYKVGNPYQIKGKWYYPKIQEDYTQVGVSSWYGDQFHGKRTANGDTFDKLALTAAHQTLPMPSMVRVTNLENNKTLLLMVNDRGPFAKDRIIDVSERAADILGFKNQGTAKVRVQYLSGHTKRLLAGLPQAQQDRERFASKEPTYPEKGTTETITMIDGTPPSKAPSSNTAKTPKPRSTNVTASALPSTEQTKTAELQTPANIETAEAESIASELNESNNVSQTATSPTNQQVTKAVKMLQHFIQAGTYSQKHNAERVTSTLNTMGNVSIIPVPFDNETTLYRVRLGPLPDDKIANMALKKVILLGFPDAMIVKDSDSSTNQMF